MNVYKVLYKRRGQIRGLILVGEDENAVKNKAMQNYHAYPREVVLLGTQKKTTT